MNPKTIAIILGGILSISLTYYLVQRQPAPLPQQALLVENDLREAPISDEDSTHLSQHTVERNSTVYETLRQAGISPQIIHQIIQASAKVRNLARVHPGTTFDLYWDATEDEIPRRLEVSIDPTKTLIIQRNMDTDEWQAEIDERPVEIATVAYQGQVLSSLWESASTAGMDPRLISDLADIFAWQVDFTREVRPGDRWRLAVERKFVDGEPIGWGAILSAEYVNASTPYTAVRFRDSKGRGAYFFPDGASLKRMFLKSPIRYARISSRFQRRRYHPILKVRRPHNGVDYAARPGTPVRTVGDGVVVKKTRNKWHGNMVKIRHNSTYHTSYSHLRAFAKKLRVGSKVNQGQVIGYVGSTGLASGPHLHFAFYEKGRFVDPLGRKFPSADPVPKKRRPEFKALAEKRQALLPEWRNLSLSSRP